MIRPVREESPGAALARLGFLEPEKAIRLLEGEPLANLAAGADFVEAVGAAADADLALRLLERILGACDDQMRSRLEGELRRDAGFRRRLVLVLGLSEALGEHLVRHPEQCLELAGSAEGEAETRPSRDVVVAALRASVAGMPAARAAANLRVEYRRWLLQLVAADLCGELTFDEVTGELADLADGVLAAGLDIALAELPRDAAPCRLAIIAMGKCGGRELNYVSDVDVIFVAEPVPAAAATAANGSASDREAAALATATILARGVMRVANEATAEGAIWEVDAGLRPEGKAGALVRTLASHIGYYQKWASTWEFQALLKARAAAGDAEIGQAYVDAVGPFVWSAATRPNFVADVQEMRRRVEARIPPGQAQWQLKLGRGGLRDVEFSVQLLQLVHGRTDVMVRSPNTIAALESLAVWGYVGRDDAAALVEAYEFLRSLEHRLQLQRLQRVSVVPDGETALRRLGRSLGMRNDPAGQLLETWHRHARVVRRLHEKLFYRPLLLAVARLDSADARLTRDAAMQRLTALGYVDPAGALANIEALSSGVSRRAIIQRTLLPVMLGWFADGPDPDAGLLGFRRVSEALGATPWYLRLLRDESSVAQRMARLLATSRYASELLIQVPEFVAALADPQQLAATDAADLRSEMEAVAGRGADARAAITVVRAVRRRELLRLAAADVEGMVEPGEVGTVLAQVTDAALERAIEIAIRDVASRPEWALSGQLPMELAVIAMGRLGGCELNYSSDADVLFVYEPSVGADSDAAARAALAVANLAKDLLHGPGPQPVLEVDAGLRPEGRAGPLVRTLASYREYYRRWSAPWEAQALLRARPCAGWPELGSRFIAMIDPLRYPVRGLSDGDLREIRRLKARMESERLPRGADPALHIKLGRGGLSDVEWVAQLLQLRHAHEQSQLRSTNTLETLAAAGRAGLIERADMDVLVQAWTFATRVRNAIMLVTGRASESVPTDPKTLAGVAAIVGLPPNDQGLLSERYLRLTRHSRAVMERLFYGWE